MYTQLTDCSYLVCACMLDLRHLWIFILFNVMACFIRHHVRWSGGCYRALDLFVAASRIIKVVT